MTKTPTVLALAAGLAIVLGSAAPAIAGTIQTLNTPEMSAAQFNNLFQPMSTAPAMSSPFQFYSSPVGGDVYSQVFQGTGAAAGLYAYAYAVTVNNVSNTYGEPVHVDGLSFQFNSTPTPTNFTGSTAAAYLVNGPVGGMQFPANSTQQYVAPSNLSWTPGQFIGTIRAAYVDPISQTPPLSAGSQSATFVVITNQPFSQQFVNLQSSNPQIGNFVPVYAATGGSISPVPVPEPATIMAWAGMLGAATLARRFRSLRKPRA